MYPIRISIAHPVDTVRIVPCAAAKRQLADAAETRAAAPADRASERIADLLPAVLESLQELELRRRAALQELQQAAVELALAVASHVVGVSIETDRLQVDRLVQAAIERLGWAGSVTVTLHPDDLRLLRKQCDLETGVPDVDWRADATLVRGSCVATCPEGTGVLYDVDRQLADIRRLWLENLDDTQVERRLAADDGQSLRRFPDRREALERA